MRRTGIILMVVGLAGFLFAGSQSTSDTSWETARWLFVGAAVMGVVLTILPGKKL